MIDIILEAITAIGVIYLGIYIYKHHVTLATITTEIETLKTKVRNLITTPKP
jgi:hypothetical protein